MTPRAALLSHSNFGSSDAPTAQKMVKALAQCPNRRIRDNRVIQPV
jgi:phosphotransacetylase